MQDRESAARTLRHSRREALFVALLWLAAITWTVGYCYLRGYRHAPDSWAVQQGLAEPRNAANFRTVAGLPDWVAYGVIAPWLVCSAATVLFGLYGMRDDDLGTERDEGAGHGA